MNENGFNVIDILFPPLGERTNKDLFVVMLLSLGALAISTIMMVFVGHGAVYEILLTLSIELAAVNLLLQAAFELLTRDHDQK